MKLGKDGKYETHPAADTFPLMGDVQLDELAGDIKANGQREECWRDEDGLVLDGRNRVIACERTGVEPKFRTYKARDMADALRFVWSLNGARRHANEWALAIAASRIATLARGRRAKNAPRGGLSQAEAAKLTGASERSAQRARAIEKNAAPELVAALERGDIGLKAAEQLAELPKAKQREALDQLGQEGKLTGAAVGKLTEAAAANDDRPPDPAVLLLRSIQGGVQRAGASIEQLDSNGLRLGFRGKLYLVQLQVLEGAPAVRASRSA